MANRSESKVIKGVQNYYRQLFLETGQAENPGKLCSTLAIWCGEGYVHRGPFSRWLYSSPFFIYLFTHLHNVCIVTLSGWYQKFYKGKEFR